MAHGYTRGLGMTLLAVARPGVDVHLVRGDDGADPRVRGGAAPRIFTWAPWIHGCGQQIRTATE
jgi:hypothetical protein